MVVRALLAKRPEPKAAKRINDKHFSYLINCLEWKYARDSHL
jgi:hypothetical protein